jgi:small subunit ribosomal protein S9
MVTKQIKKTEKTVKPASAVKAVPFEGRYKQGVGGRKTASAQVRLFSKSSGMIVNDKDYTKYFPTAKQQQMVMAPLKTAELLCAMGVTVKVFGGGIMAQAGAVRHGLTLALVSHDPELRKKLKREGFMTRDPRHVERKKYGLKKARRAPQWAKR